MDPRIAALVDANTPKLNMALARGLAYEHMKGVEKYIDDLWKEVAKGFPPGFTYVKGVRCTPQEEFNEASIKGGKLMYDMAQSDVRLMKYVFSYNGKQIDRYLYLPYVRPGGIIFLNGSRFVISPVLADRVISIGHDFVFARLGRARPSFRRVTKSWLANGRMETGDVVWSLLHNKKSKNKNDKPSVNASTTMVHYLFCKYGFFETFERFAGAHPVVGTPTEINTGTYPASEWTICQTVNLKLPNRVKLAIRNEEYQNEMTKNLVAGFFYIIEHFVQWRAVEPTFLESKRWWCILLGHMLPGSSASSDSKLADEMADHIHSLDAYIDEIIRREFKEIGFEIDNIYQFFAIIIEKFSHWILSYGSEINSMYDKELSVLNYVLNDITNEINTFSFRLGTASRKKTLTENEILGIMNKTVKPGLIFKIKKPTHGEVSTVSAACDNMAFKTTSILIPQTDSNKQTGNKGNENLDNPAYGLHVSVAEYGGYTFLPKSEPSGRSRLNHFALTMPNGLMLRNPDFKEDLDIVQSRIALKGERQSREIEIDLDSIDDIGHEED